MKIIVISDLHSKFSILPLFLEKIELLNADLIISCGDLTDFGSPIELKRMLSEISSKIPIISVLGNCDPPNALEDEDLKKYLLHGEYAIFDDTVISGVSGANITPFRTPFELSEEELSSLLFTSIPKESYKYWIVVSHVPPYGFLDTPSDDLHVGSRALREFIVNYSPDYLLCGHIHEARGSTELSSTTIVNPGPLSKGFYAVLELNTPKLVFANL